MPTQPLSVIRFGTDGWRAVIAQDFTFDNVRRVARGLAEAWRESRDEGPVMVGFDTRFLSDRFARAAAEVMASEGFQVILADRPCSSPAISWSVREHVALGAIMLTASHNPPEYNGFKIKAGYGGSASPELTARIEAALTRELPLRSAGAEPLATFDPTLGYFRQLARLVDLDAIARAGLHVLVDAMHGAGAGYLGALLAQAGMTVTELHAERDPSFGGINPEPIAPNLQELRHLTAEAARRHPLTVGLAFDGDADRIGAVGASGAFINSHQILSLILEHLAEIKGWRGGVVRTFSTSQLVLKLAESYGLPCFETPIGFKYICDLMLREEILVGGEESGGIGIPRHLPERDGVLCGLLLLEIMATRGATLDSLIDRLEDRFGPHRYDRIDLHLADHAAKDRALASLLQRPPAQWAGLPVISLETLDGLKFRMDGAWLMFRASGTEPLLRIYAEAPTMEQVQALLDEGRAIAEGA